MSDIHSLRPSVACRAVSHSLQIFAQITQI